MLFINLWILKTALHLAVERGNIDIIKALLANKNSDVNVEDSIFQYILNAMKNYFFK